MSWIKSLEPKDTEEVRPGFFIQKKYKGYRQVHPAAWNGKIIWKNFLIGGSYGHIIWFLIILFLAFGYYHDTKVLRDFYEDVRGDPVAFCEKVELAMTAPECTEDLQRYGLCSNLSSVNSNFSLEVVNGNSNIVSSNS